MPRSTDCHEQRRSNARSCLRPAKGRPCRVRVSLFRRKPSGVGYRLGDGEALNREHLDTFPIPTRDRRERLKPGDLVKLLFEAVGPEEGRSTAERMWVQATRVAADSRRI